MALSQHPMNLLNYIVLLANPTLTLVSMTLRCPGSHPSFLTTAPRPILFITFSLPFSSSVLTTGIHKGSVLDSWSSLSPCTPLGVSSIPVYYSQFSHFGLPPKQQFCKTTFHRHLRSLIFETELSNLKQLFLLISYCEGTVPPFVR